MATLVTDPNIAAPDDFYEELILLHRDLTDAQSALVNAKLVLLLANHVGDAGVLRAAMAAAREDVGAPRLKRAHAATFNVHEATMSTATTKRRRRRARGGPHRRTRRSRTSPASATSSRPRRLPGALPVGQNSPQRAPYGLYAEQISGTAFTAPRGANRRTWTYRIRPAAVHEPFRRIGNGRIVSAFGDVATPPNQLRWDPLPLPDAPTDFVDGLVTMAGNGDPAAMTGCAIHLYAANRSMTDRFFYDADGELLIVPQQGRLRIATELGRLDVAPQEIAVIPRGIRFRVELPDANPEPGARLRLRELRRAAAAARPGRHRLERARQPARLPDAARVVRGPRRRVRAGREVHGQPVVGGDRPFAARRRRVARQLRAVQVRPRGASTRSARSATTIRIRRSSSCCSRRATRRAWTRSTS